MPELQQALERAHAWATYAADGRLVRVGGLRGAPAEAREVVADIASQWQWIVPERVGAEAARRERDGAHTLRATYRHLGISRGAFGLATAAAAPATPAAPASATSHTPGLPMQPAPSC